MNLKVYILPPLNLIFSQAMLNIIVYQMLIVTNVPVNSAALQFYNILLLQTLLLDSAVRSEAPLKQQFNNPYERGNRGNLNGLLDLFVTTPTFSYPVFTNILLSNTLFKRTSERHADQLQNKVSTNTKPEGKHFSVITLLVSSVVVAKG